MHRLMGHVDKRTSRHLMRQCIEETFITRCQLALVSVCRCAEEYSISSCSYRVSGEKLYTYDLQFIFVIIAVILTFYLLYWVGMWLIKSTMTGIRTSSDLS
ncbi:hypothetical protein GcC1_003017 [Golovinomyces cichoracearum]|uniref:Uncharacterized protein n=1 Tax=Golovinomyces cichoracearum TaxID=62708 RepID=A0A420J9D2_9PEZI|nr:hypothetical protein GcC1_003017 [Golovinomyces cichoracearum]